MKNLITYGTHLPVLARAIKVLQPSTIMEIGGGLSSTPFLNQMSSKDCLVETFENNKTFFDIIKELSSNHHKINFISDWNSIPLKKVNILFIDHAPAERRIIDIEKFKDHADIIIVHDFEKKKYYNYNKIIPLFKYCVEYDFYPKTTGILSNYIDVMDIFRH